MNQNVRVDKWLWSVRIFKTRGLATDACKKGYVSIDNLPVKPSRTLKPNVILKVSKPPIVRTYKVLKLAEKRMPAKMVDLFMEDITPPEELEVLEIQKNMTWFSRDKGKGRPTKKERRDMDKFINK